jgi:LPPG:FO 2-phospho-L-lactate transferase
VLLLCPSNPVVSIGPILALPGVRDAVASRTGPVVGISPIVAGAPLAGMADKLMPVRGLEVSAIGAARAYRDLLSGWVIDERDRGSARRIEEELHVRVTVTDTVMRDDEIAAAVAHAAVELAS